MSKHRSKPYTKFSRADDRRRGPARRKTLSTNTCEGCGDMVQEPGAEFCSESGEFCAQMRALRTPGGLFDEVGE